MDASTSSPSLVTQSALRRHPIASIVRVLRCAFGWAPPIARSAARSTKVLARRALHWLQGEPGHFVAAPSRRLEKGRSTRCERRLVSECEAFLAGRYHKQLPRHARWDWAWVNALAHGERTEIEALARARGRRARAAAFAAAEVLATGDRHGLELTWLQARYLVPVEVSCMRSGSLSPAAATHRVLAALRRALGEAGPGAPEHGA